MNNTSPRFSLNATDLWKVLRGGAVTVLATILTYVASIYMNFNYTIVYGETAINLTPFAIPVIGAIIEFGRRFVADNS